MIITIGLSKDKYIVLKTESIRYKDNDLICTNTRILDSNIRNKELPEYKVVVNITTVTVTDSLRHTVIKI